MSRTIAEIYNEMVEEKQNFVQLNLLQPQIDSSQSLLNDLTTSSKVAVWRLIFFVVAVGIWSLEKLFDKHVEWIEYRAKEIIPGNTSWYEKKALEFQYGDDLVFQDGQYKYPIIDESKKKVTLAKVSEGGGFVLIKVANNISSTPEPLQPLELEALQNYFKKVKFAGIKLSIVSRPADLLKIYYKIYFNPLLLGSNGELLSNPSIFPVEDIINAYIIDIPFNGIFRYTDLTDKIQSIEGIINPIYLSGEVKYGALDYEPLPDNYIANSGYFQIDTNFPLSLTLEYVPYV